jgi:hypothetical protein
MGQEIEGCTKEASSVLDEGLIGDLLEAYWRLVQVMADRMVRSGGIRSHHIVLI